MTNGERERHLLDNLADKARNFQYSCLDLADDVSALINNVTLAYTLWRGIKPKSSLADLTLEERWGNPTLQTLEKWLIDQSIHQGVQIGMAMGVWLLNPRYFNPKRGRSLPIAISGSHDENGLRVATYYPSLLSDDPNIDSVIKTEFESQVQPPVKYNARLSVSQLYIGDKLPEVSFVEEARKKIEQEQEEFIGIYEQDLKAELSTICRPGYAKKILDHPGLLGLAFYLSGKPGDWASIYKANRYTIVTNLIMNTWVPNSDLPTSPQT